MANPYVTRFFGGPPLAVTGKLILLSILIGVVLSTLGLDPWNIVDSVRQIVHAFWKMGFEAFYWLWRYFLLGAVLVVPIWLIMRLIRAGK
jgi:energy-converting hydrogenase Eha subunit G